jgi:hypothetical protein
MFILKEAKRKVDAHTKKVADRIESMAASGRLDGLSLSDFRVLQSVMQRWLNNENPEFIQGEVADWLGKNDIYVKSKGIGFIIVESTEAVREASNVPALAKVTGISTKSQFTQVARQNTIFGTLQAMGLDPYVNKMRNVVVEVPTIQDAPAVMQTIYAQFGVKSSVTITWEGKPKIYWDPKTPVDKAPALAYAKQAGLPPPNFNKLLESVFGISVWRDDCFYRIGNT